MKNIEEILKDNGIELTDAQKAAVSKSLSENYKTVAEYDKKVGKLETERDGYKEQLDTATETLKSFDGIDPAEVSKKTAEYEKKLEELEEKHKQELYDRDFADTLDESIKTYEFTSEYAKQAVLSEIKAAGLKLVDGKIIGLNDLVDTIKAKDATAFVDPKQKELEGSKAKFTEMLKGGKEGKKPSMSDLMKLKNENPDMDISQYM